MVEEAASIQLPELPGSRGNSEIKKRKELIVTALNLSI